MNYHSLNDFFIKTNNSRADNRQIQGLCIKQRRIKRCAISSPHHLSPHFIFLSLLARYSLPPRPDVHLLFVFYELSSKSPALCLVVGISTDLYSFVLLKICLFYKKYWVKGQTRECQQCNALYPDLKRSLMTLVNIILWLYLLLATTTHGETCALVLWSWERWTEQQWMHII